jgi:hypothetical protein
MSGEVQRVRVAPGRTLHRGPGSAPFRAGDLIELPADHAAELAAAGHVESAASDGTLSASEKVTA